VKKRREVSARGDSELSMEDLESMEYLQAALKETLRFHPIVFHLFRMPVKDDIIPLSEPIITSSGEVISELHVRRGQNIIASVAGYNRVKSVWGEDADIWNPLRFIEDKTEKPVKVGMYANLMTFSAGVRSCIGWRFS